MAFNYFFLLCLSYYLNVSNINCDEKVIQESPYVIKQGAVKTAVAPRMFYQISGNGNKVLVLLDGTNGCIEHKNFKDFYNAMDLVNTYTIVQVDLPGFGESRVAGTYRTYTGMGGDYEDGAYFERDADAVIQTLEVLKIREYSVLGWGFGGTVALFISSRAPAYKHVVKKCIEWNAKPYSSQDFVDLERKNRKPVKDWDGEIRNILLNTYGEHYLQKTSDNQLDGWQALADINNEPSHKALQKINVPVLLLSATDNKFAKSDQYEMMETDMPNAKAIIFTTSKHDIHELPEFPGVVERFLDEENYPDPSPLKIQCSQ